MQERRSSSLCVDWDLYQNIGLTDAKGKKDIIDNMHEHKVYQQILEQQHLNIIISLSFGNDSGIQPIFLRLQFSSGLDFLLCNINHIYADRIPGVLARLRSQRVLGIWGRNKISSQVPCLIIVPHFKELFFRCHCHVEVSKCIKNLGVKTKSGHRY